ncbi:MFS transporter [Rossellomorea marisflavi]|uniref:MFS transporter n=1 Tax=Rossellomorea marisflavi TaxID=189381 RepID=UPI0039BF26E6
MMKMTRLEFVLLLLPLLMVLGNSMLIPILPEIEASLGLEGAWSGFILSAFTIPAAIVIPAVGVLSDRFGRSFMVKWSLYLMILGSLICVMSGGGSGLLFMTGRVIQGLGAAGTTPLAMALAGDLFSGEKRTGVLAALEVSNGAGKVLAPILGATLAFLLPWNHSFWVYILVSFIILAGLRKELSVEKRKSGSFRGTGRYMRDIQIIFKKKWMLLVPLYAVGGTGLFVLFGILYFLSYHIENTFHIDGFFKGLAFLFPLGAMVVTSYWCGKRLKEGNGGLYMGTGVVLMVAASGGLFFWDSLSGLMFLLTVCFGGLGLLLPVINSEVTGAVGEEERGLVVSLYGTSRFAGVALGPIAYGRWKEDVTSMYGWTFAFVVALALTYMYFLKEKSAQ